MHTADSIRARQEHVGQLGPDIGADAPLPRFCAGLRLFHLNVFASENIVCHALLSTHTVEVDVASNNSDGTVLVSASSVIAQVARKRGQNFPFSFVEVAVPFHGGEIEGTTSSHGLLLALGKVLVLRRWMYVIRWTGLPLGVPSPLRQTPTQRTLKSWETVPPNSSGRGAVRQCASSVNGHCAFRGWFYLALRTKQTCFQG